MVRSIDPVTDVMTSGPPVAGDDGGFAVFGPGGTTIGAIEWTCGAPSFGPGAPTLFLRRIPVTGRPELHHGTRPGLSISLATGGVIR